MNNIKAYKIQIFIAVVAALLFLPFIGGMHLFDWDEINFAESAREMIVTGDYLTVQINFTPFWEKPPLFIWMQVVSMKAFGINEFAARFPNAICGIVTLLVLFNIGRKLRDNQFGVIWVLAYVGSILPFLYFKSGIIDPWFNLFIFLSIYFLMLYSFPENKKRIQNIVLSASFAGLAVMTKGPVGFLLVAITGGIYLLIIRFKIKVKFIEVLTYLFVLAIVGGFWFIIMIFKGNYDTVVEFIVYQIRLFQTKDAGHGGFLGYHFVVLLLGVFPTSILALKSFRNENLQEPLYKLMKKWMMILFWVVLILFTIVKTKIVHYSSLAYFPITFLAANFVYNAITNKANWNKWISVVIIAITALMAIPVMAIQFVEKYKNVIIEKNWIKDDFTAGNLQTDVHWTGFEFLNGALFLVFVILIFMIVKKEAILKRVVLLWTATAFFILSIILFIIPKVEKYSQNTVIEFVEKYKDQDVYVKSINFKSYAPYFYGKTIPSDNPNSNDFDWLVNGDIDKDIYFVTRNNQAPKIANFTNLIKTHEKNGFVFYVRKVK